MTGRVGTEERAVEVLEGVLPASTLDVGVDGARLVQALSDAGLVIVAREDVLTSDEAAAMLARYHRRPANIRADLRARAVLKRLSGTSNGRNEDE